MVRSKALLFIILLLASVSTWASVTARVDRTELYNDETLVLNVTVSPISKLDDADITALKTLFDIIRTDRSESHQIINGRTSSQIDYQFRLQPKRIGNLAIPNFHSGNEQSQPIFISVLDASKRKDGLADDAVTLSATLDNASPYIDQPVYLTVEIAAKINFQGGQLSSIEAPEFDIETVDDQQFQRNSGSQTSNVYRYVYKLTAKQPGLFQLPSVRFTAQYPNRQLGRYMPVSRSAKIEAIEVKPMPASFPAGAYWLPAKKLALADNLKTPLQVPANEHLEWQVTATTAGLDARRLPDLLAAVENQLPGSIKAYKNNPSFTDNQRTDSVALVFTQPGNVTLPEVRIPWWNLTTDTLEWATLPARQVQVIASANSTATDAAPRPQLQTSTAAPTQSLAATIASPQATNRLWQFTTALFAILWLATLGYMLYRLRGSTQPTAKARPTVTSGRKAVVNIDQPKAVYQRVIELLTPGNQRAALPKAEAAVLLQLEQALFQDGDLPSQNQLKALLKAAEKLARQRTDAAQDGDFVLY